MKFVVKRNLERRRRIWVQLYDDAGVLVDQRPCIGIIPGLTRRIMRKQRRMLAVYKIMQAFSTPV